MQKAHEEQLVELRAAQENALREWRVEYDKVCNLLKSDGLKFEEALRQQESEYENQIVEILERERKALQDESEKATTALKDGVSMKQTIGMLQNQVKAKDAELIEAAQQQEELRKKLQASQEMVDKVRAQLKERERSLKVKDESLNKLREQMKHLESFRFVLFHKVRALEEERDPLEEQVNSLKTSVREMYNEFVREFRQKQKLDQALSDKVMRSSSLQQENVELRAQLIQLKKDGRRLIQEVETVLHPETTEDYTQMPKRLQAVLERHQKLLAWKHTEEKTEDVGEGELAKSKVLVEEMVIQRDLLFRKKEIATAAAAQTKRECEQDVRKLTSENAQLIVEMNTLRSENRPVAANVLREVFGTSAVEVMIDMASSPREGLMAACSALELEAALQALKWIEEPAKDTDDLFDEGYEYIRHIILEAWVDTKESDRDMLAPCLDLLTSLKFGAAVPVKTAVPAGHISEAAARWRYGRLWFAGG
ncbi:Cfap57 [Symbiodinium microadriaticum]|nr:Cfap57 [Symbiodinium microadriaticum]